MKFLYHEIIIFISIIISISWNFYIPVTWVFLLAFPCPDSNCNISVSGIFIQFKIGTSLFSYIVECISYDRSCVIWVGKMDVNELVSLRRIERSFDRVKGRFLKSQKSSGASWFIASETLY